MKYSAVALLLVAIAATAITAQARPSNPHNDPFVTAFRDCGGSGGSGGCEGDGTIHYTIDNALGVLPIGFFQVKVSDKSEFKTISAVPTGWSASATIGKGGKFVGIVFTSDTNPVPAGGTLSGFDTQILGSTPFSQNWKLVDSSGGVWSGSLTIS